MTTYQILYAVALYAALQVMAYLERRRNKNIRVPISYAWNEALNMVNVCLVAIGLATIFFNLGA